MYGYDIEDIFSDEDYLEEFKEDVVGTEDDDYYYTIDDIVKWVILQKSRREHRL